jgi:hypothetical protein
VDSVDFFENKELIKQLKAAGKIKVKIGYNKSVLDKLEIFSDEIVSLSVHDENYVVEESVFSSLDFSKFKNLRNLKFSIDMSCLTGAVSVKSLLDKTPDSLENLTFCPYGSYRSYKGFDFTGVDFSKFKNLKKLNIYGRPPRGFSCDVLKTVSDSLEELWTISTDLSDFNFGKFKSLKVLSVGSCDGRFSARALNTVSESLEHLDVQDSVHGINDLSRFKNLKTLTVNGGDFTVGLRDSISSELEGLFILHEFDPKVGDFSRFEKLKSLVMVGRQDDNFTPKMLDTITSEVEALHLSLLDPKLSAFSRFKNLWNLELSFEGPISDEVLEKVKSTIKIKLKEDSDPACLPHVLINRSSWNPERVWLTNIDK